MQISLKAQDLLPDSEWSGEIIVKPIGYDEKMEFMASTMTGAEGDTKKNIQRARDLVKKFKDNCFVRCELKHPGLAEPVTTWEDFEQVGHDLLQLLGQKMLSGFLSPNSPAST